jgi:hypothetical protein
MSRSGYSEECDNWSLICWRGAVTSASRGARGQKFFKDLLAALDAMPVKELIADELQDEEGVCALGALGQARGLALEEIDPEDHQSVAVNFNIARALAREVVYVNDEDGRWEETSEQRWQRVRRWVQSNIEEPIT